jgi:hypothetical protein
VRFVNTSMTASVTISLQLAHTVGSTETIRQIGPASLSIPANGLYVEKQEVTIGPGDVIKVSTSAAGGPVDFVISGFEREL